MHITTEQVKNMSALASAEAATTSSTEPTLAVIMAQQGEENPDPFDGSAEPTIYMSENRMPVMIEFSSAIIYVIFAALLLALISILPGIRRTRMASFLGLVTIILVGATILLAMEGSNWLTGEVQLHGVPYGALTSETITGKLEVNIGLSSTNVSLVGRLIDFPGSRSKAELEDMKAGNKYVDYNERFHWDRPERMAIEHTDALSRGLPYPILTVTEFLSQDSDGFNWMRQLRRAGYFTSLALYASLASWCLTIIVLCALPVYLAHMMQITGALMLSSVWIYTMLIQSPKSFVIQLGGSSMVFAFGFTYALTFMAGALSMFSGVLMLMMQINKPHESITIMDCENFSKNQRALCGHIGQLDSNDIISTTKPTKREESVVISVADIEARIGTKREAS